MLSKLAQLLKAIITFPYKASVTIIGFAIVFPPMFIMILRDPMSSFGVIDAAMGVINKINVHRKRILSVGEEDEMGAMMVFSIESSRAILFYLMAAAIIKLYFFRA